MSLVGGRNQAVPIKLVARDENGNLAHIALIEENGTVLAQESCVPDMTAECTLVLTMTSPEGYGQRLRFSAVAVDQDGLRSETISFIVATNLPAVGGSGKEGRKGRKDRVKGRKDRVKGRKDRKDRRPRRGMNRLTRRRRAGPLFP